MRPGHVEVVIRGRTGGNFEKDPAGHAESRLRVKSYGAFVFVPTWICARCPHPVSEGCDDDQDGPLWPITPAAFPPTRDSG